MEKEMQQIKPYNSKVQTQILDPSMPSELIDDQKNHYGQKQVKLEHNEHIQGPPRPAVFDPDLQSYTVKGKSMFKMLAKYQKHSHINVSLPTLPATMDPIGVGGLKGLWESIVGYCTRELYICEGFIYVLEKQNQGYFIHDLWSLDELFKVFNDNEDSKIRLVFNKNHKIIENVDFKTAKSSEILHKIREELKKMGLEML